MATSVVPATLSGGINLKSRDCLLPKYNVGGKTLTMRKMSNQQRPKRDLSVRAESNDHKGPVDFLAGVVVGGVLFGTLVYNYSPQLRRYLRNENEHGFTRARKPLYYDESYEGTRHTLHAKIQQLNNAIDNVALRLRLGKNYDKVKKRIDPEEAAAF